MANSKVVSTKEGDAGNVRELKAIEKGQVGMFWRGARLALGLPAGIAGGAVGAASGSVAAPKDDHGGIMPNMTRRVKLGNVVDQGDEMEVDAMEPVP